MKKGNRFLLKRYFCTATACTSEKSTPYPLSIQTLLGSLLLATTLLFAPFTTLHANTLNFGAGAGTSADGFEDLLLDVSVNDTSYGMAFLIRDANDRVLASYEDIMRWNFALTDQQLIEYRGMHFYYLDEFKGLTYDIDIPSLTLLATAPPSLFTVESIDAGDSYFVQYGTSTPGAFFNYDILTEYTTSEGSDVDLSAITEMGVFTPYGVGINSILLRNIADSPEAIRLDTTWYYDLPEQMLSLVLGDTYTRPGDWSGSARYGGIKLATNFGTQPGFVTYPLPTLAGEATIPTTVDILVDNVLRAQQEVNAGPFEIYNLPYLTGQGEVQLVTRDLLGREQVITVPFFTAQELLRPGLHDFTVDLGFTRDDYTEDSFDYNRFVTAGTYRRGLTERFTGEVHGEFLFDQQAVGMSGNYIMPHVGLTTLSLAGSQSNDLGVGGLAKIALERPGEIYSIGASVQGTTSNMTYLGLQPDQPAPAWIVQIYNSWSLGRYGQVGLSYIFQEQRDFDQFYYDDDDDDDDLEDEPLMSAGKTQFLTINYGVGLLPNLYFNASSTVNIDEPDDYAFYLTLTWSFDNDRSMTLAGNIAEDANQVLLDFVQYPPFENGYGYRLAAGAGDFETYEADVIYQNDYGVYQADVAYYDDDFDARLAAEGGVIYMNRNVFFSRPVEDSFAVVTVPGYADVGIYENDVMYARTNKRGSTLLTNVLSYQENYIGINPADFPLDVQFDTTRHTVVPTYRSGTLISFLARASRSATLSLFIDDEVPMPIGSEVTLTDHDNKYYVGQDGYTFISGLVEGENHIEVRRDNISCQATIFLPETEDVMPDLGSVFCDEVNYG